MRKWLCLSLAVVLFCTMGSAASAEWKFTHKIDIVCPWGVDGGADTTLRALTPLLEGALGAEVDIVNVAGGSGVYGVEYAYKQPADGYTFMLGTQSLIMQDLQGNTSMDFKTAFVPVVKLVHSINIIAGSKKALDDKNCHTFSELVAYVKDNPHMVKAGMLTSKGVDGVSLRQSFAGMDVREVSYSGASEMLADLINGNIDIAVTGLDEISYLIASGDVVALCAVAEKRMKMYPDMQCTGELGIQSFMGPWRGIYAKAGTPQEAIDAFVAGVAKAVQNAAWQDFLEVSAYDERPGYASSVEFTKLNDEEYKTIAEFLRESKTLKKEY